MHVVVEEALLVERTFLRPSRVVRVYFVDLRVALRMQTIE